MKIIQKISFIVALALIMTASSCKKLLQENPKSNEYAPFLATQTGAFSAITGVYSDLRYFYSSEGNVIGFYSGTDEQQFGGSATTTVFATYNGLNSGNTVSWSSMYQDINTLNAAIQYSTQSTTMDASSKKLYIAQAKFLRAFIYYYLVTTYGATSSAGGVTEATNSGIPLHTTFITQATTADQPASLSAVYAQIIQDLTDASADLPNTVTSTDPFSGTGIGKTGTVAVAQAYLAKVYLTRGYTAAAVAGDFQKAADITSNLITNQSVYGLGLWPDYAQAMDQANDYGKENMFAFDMGADPTYSNYNVGSSGGRGLNQLPVFFRWNYISNAGVNSDASVPQKVTGPSPEFRDMYNGRPYIRSRPNTAYTIQYAFADQVHDSRFDATFQTFWICNQTTPPGLQTDGKTLKGALIPTTPTSTTTYIPPLNGDTGILFPQLLNSQIPLARRNSFKGMMTSIDQYSNVVFPTVKKFDDKTGRLTMNDFSTRPVVELRFSEVYMMNAEANYMLGNVNAAAASLNVIRERAAYRTPADGTYIPASAFKVTAANQGSANAVNAAAMDLTPAQRALLSIPNNTAVGSGQCGMDLILDEYTREYYGDLRRWYDLTRTGQLLRRVKMYNPEAGANIQAFHVLRPIPIQEIQTVVSGPAYPQNPGY
ncbi:MAG: carbohydrate-binding protein SusD [Mucilaginibacter sp.]|nr:carbohydrate-binding protein SusD [Mucilaginibacter sp.]